MSDVDPVERGTHAAREHEAIVMPSRTCGEPFLYLAPAVFSESRRGFDGHGSVRLAPSPVGPCA